MTTLPKCGRINEQIFAFIGEVGSVGRKLREWLPDVVYHIVSRGNRKEPLFHDGLDYFVFLRILGAAQQKMDVSLFAYCLMKNHFHLLLSTSSEPIWKLMGSVNRNYALYYNNRYDVCGHLFEKRYYSSPVHGEYGLLKVSRYIHRNPVEAKLVQQPQDYRWSSYSAYLDTDQPKAGLILHPDRVYQCVPSGTSEQSSWYRSFVEQHNQSTA